LIKAGCSTIVHYNYLQAKGFSNFVRQDFCECQVYGALPGTTTSLIVGDLLGFFAFEYESLGGNPLEEEVVVCFVEMYCSEAINLRIARFFF